MVYILPSLGEEIYPDRPSDRTATGAPLDRLRWRHFASPKSIEILLAGALSPTSRAILRDADRGESGGSTHRKRLLP